MLPVHLNLLADERLYGFGILFGADNEELVTDVEDGLVVGNADVPFVADARADKCASQELLHLYEGFAGERFVAHLQTHDVRLVLVVGLLVAQLLFIFFEVDPADVADGDDGTDDAHHAKRIGAGISQGDGVARIVQLVQRFVGGTQTGGVGHGTIQDTYNHRQLNAPVDEVDAQCHHHVQHHDAHGERVQLHAPFLERGEERRPYLQTDAEYKQNQAELADEMQDVRLAREAEVSHQDAGEEHERHSQ